MHDFKRRALLAALGVLFSLATISPALADNVRYTVVPGDTLSGIAHAYGITVREIADLNHIADPNLIFPGHVLDIVTGRSSSPSSSDYVVQPGDNLTGIAARFGVSIAAIQSANGIQDPNFLRIGQHLAIPSTAAPAPAPRGLGPKPSSPRVEGIIADLSRQWNVDPNLVKALAWVESGWNQGAVSPAGAMGVMQIMPGTSAWLQSDVLGEQLNVRSSAYDNVKMGVALLRLLLDATKGDVDLALASYYQGHGSVVSGKIYDETKSYVATIHAVKDAWWP